MKSAYRPDSQRFECGLHLFAQSGNRLQYLDDQQTQKFLITPKTIDSCAEHGTVPILSACLRGSILTAHWSASNLKQIFGALPELPSELQLWHDEITGKNCSVTSTSWAYGSATIHPNACCN